MISNITWHCFVNDVTKHVFLNGVGCKPGCKVAYLSSFTVCFRINFWSSWPCCFVVPLLVNSGVSKTRPISWQILVFLSLRLVISVKKMQGNVWSKTWKIKQAAFLRLYGLDFTYYCNEKIFFSLRVLLIWTVIYLFVAASFSVGKYRLGTVCTRQRWKTCAGLAPRRWKDFSSIAVLIRPWMSIALNQ